MFSKLSTVLVLLALVTSLVFAPFQEVQKDFGKGENTLRVYVVTNCQENGISVTDAADDRPVEGVHVVVKDTETSDIVLSAYTTGQCSLVFPGCGMNVNVEVTKSNYRNQVVTAYLVPCSICPELKDFNQSNQTQPEVECTPPTCCTSDTQCGDVQSCDSSSGNGTCANITGQCGYAVGHTWIRYQCGDPGLGCSNCPTGEKCVNNTCVQPDLDCPNSGFVGEEKKCTATEGPEPCKECPVEILTPQNQTITGQTNESGDLTLPLTIQGTYRVTLIKDGVPIKTIDINAIPKSQSPDEKKATSIFDNVPSWLIWLLILLTVGSVLFLYLRRKGEKLELTNKSDSVLPPPPAEALRAEIERKENEKKKSKIAKNEKRKK